MFSRSLTVWINQSITQYKVLNLLQVPYHLKISFNSRKHAYGSYYFVTSSMRLRDHGEAVIEFICFNKWNEAKPRYEAKLPLRKLSLRCRQHRIKRILSRRVGSAAFKPAEKWCRGLHSGLKTPKFVCLDSWTQQY